MKLRCALFLMLLMSGVAVAQEGPPQYVIDGVQAVESMLDSEGDAPIDHFIDDAMAPDPERDRDVLVSRLNHIRDEVRGLRDELAVDAAPGGVVLILSAGGVERQVRVVLGPDGISDLYLQEAPAALELSRENLADTFARLEAEGFAGVAHVKLDGEVVFERAFGMANPELGIANALDTVFGTGSRPIDYTVAAILLLDQRGLLDLDDTLDRHFEDVPADKQSMTIRHLLNGESGLPDFFHTEDDEDPDLTWIDRETAEKRLLSQQLLFAPGTDQEHSHGAFGLLAALIERVTHQGYYEFIRESFLDPAGMDRTGENGEFRGLALEDFAVGGGPQFVGDPNIPPNWGPTSWLIKGSGGMYSTLGDLQKFYELVRSDTVLNASHNAAFRGPTANVDGSDRGFELFSTFNPEGSEVYLFLNAQGDRATTRQLIRALERLVMSGE